ncbi:MAG: ATP-binding protein [Planctomycetes bacterium]|nr:ATP-binding protein [Planctomycetota bacterium]
MNIEFDSIIKEKLVTSVEAVLPVKTKREVTVPSLSSKAIVAIGMRRTGKTTWLHQRQQEYLERGYDREDLIFFNFEDERLQGFSPLHLQRIVDSHNRIYPHKSSKKRVIFFDEIQLVAGWEMFVRRILDEGEYEIYLTGSSAKLLSREIASAMRGRAWEIEIFPFSFQEVLVDRNLTLQKKLSHMNKSTKAEIDHHFESYLQIGGLPEAQSMKRPDRFQLLQGYVDTLLMRDIVDRYQITNPTALRWLVRRLMASPGGLFSVSKFALDLKSQGISVGKETLYEYLDHLEDAYLLETISIASDSIKRKQVNPRKIYPIDPGFIPLFDRSRKSNIGHALESATYIQLRRRKADVAYVKTKNGFEVDFLARYIEGEEELIQVCYSIEDPDTFERETRSLLEASSEHPNASLILLTGDSSMCLHKIAKGIEVISAWEWMLRVCEG